MNRPARTPAQICRDRRVRVLTIRGYGSLAAKAVLLTLACLVIFTQLFLLTQSSGNGMFPAIKDGDLVLAYRLQSSFGKGDVMVYTVEGTAYIGRIIAQEADVVQMDDSGNLQVNGTAQSGGILYPTYAKPGMEYPYQVPDGCVFLLADYRTQCQDSRDFGPIPLEDIQGKVVTIVRRRGL